MEINIGRFFFFYLGGKAGKYFQALVNNHNNFSYSKVLVVGEFESFYIFVSAIFCEQRLCKSHVGFSVKGCKWILKEWWMEENIIDE